MFFSQHSLLPLREEIDEEEDYGELETIARTRTSRGYCCPVISAGYLRSQAMRQASRNAAMTAAAATVTGDVTASALVTNSSHATAIDVAGSNFEEASVTFESGMEQECMSNEDGLPSGEKMKGFDLVSIMLVMLFLLPSLVLKLTMADHLRANCQSFNVLWSVVRSKYSKFDL